MGNAVVKALFPDLFLNYLIFTLPLWSFIYAWGLGLLIPEDKAPTGNKVSKVLKSFVNPMFICMILGMLIGISGWQPPLPVLSAINVCGECMSPVAMILTGIVLARTPLREVLKRKSIYAVTFFRLIVIPALFALLCMFLPVTEEMTLCLICSLAMPLGLNVVVIPSGYGADVSTAAGMTLVSHLASVLTIPLVLTVLETVM